jgi:hypothetical protein
MSDIKEPTRIIGIDYSIGSDYTVITQKCSACNSVISCETVISIDKTVKVKIITECPVCGVEFKKRIRA